MTATAMIRKTYRITGMTCPNCAMTLEGLEDDLPGVLRVSASYRKGTMQVEYDEKKVGEAEILAAVTQRGYGVEEDRAG